MNLTPTRVAYIQIALAQISFGFWAWFLRSAKVDPRWSAMFVLLTAAVVVAPLLLFPWARGPREGGRRTLGEWGLIGLLGVFNAGGVLFYFFSLKTAVATIGVFAHCFAPLLIAVLAPSLLGTPRNGRMILLAAIALVGFTLILEPWKLSQEGDTFWSTLAGAGWGAAGAVFVSGYVLVNKRLAGRFTPEERLAYNALIGALLLAIVAVSFRTTLPNSTQALQVIGAGALLGGLGGVFFLRGLQRIKAEEAGILMLLEPLAALLIGWLVWDERLGATGLAGAAILIIAGGFALGVRKPQLPQTAGGAEGGLEPIIGRRV